MTRWPLITSLVVVLVAWFQSIDLFYLLEQGSSSWQTSLPPSTDKKSSPESLEPSYLNHTHYLRPRRSFLPTCGSRGCIIFFIHIPKTGGTSFSTTIRRRGLPYSVFKAGSSLEASYRRIEQSLKEGTPRGKPHFWELHTNNVPSFMDHVPHFERWRSISEQSGVPFLVFTLVRESVAVAVSRFQHFCLREQPHHVNRYNCSNATATERDLLQTTWPNPHCQFLLTGQTRMAGTNTKLPSEEDCRRVFGQLQTHADWIGTTERYRETSAILQYITNRTWEEYITNASPQRQSNLIRKDQLQATTRHYLQAESYADGAFYQHVQRTYSLDTWSSRDQRDVLVRRLYKNPPPPFDSFSNTSSR